MDLSPDSCRPHPFSNVFEQMLRAVIEDGVHRVQPKAVEVKLLDPVESIMNDKLAHGAAVGPVKIDCAAPRRLVAVGKSLRRDRMNVSALRTEVIVNHIEQHHQPAAVCGFDQRFQILGPAIGRVWGVGQHAVIAPVAAARKVADRHDLDGGYAKRNQMVELADCGTKGALRRKGADVQFVDDRLLPGAAASSRRRAKRTGRGSTTSLGPCTSSG